MNAEAQDVEDSDDAPSGVHRTTEGEPPRTSTSLMAEDLMELADRIGECIGDILEAEILVQAGDTGGERSEFIVRALATLRSVQVCVRGTASTLDPEVTP